MVSLLPCHSLVSCLVPAIHSPLASFPASRLPLASSMPLLPSLVSAIPLPWLAFC
jgi:hypothetical protein